ncbi:hypothetical protein M2317_002307 [Microbacterium sp. ZKA21]|uniref:sugar-binding domain-containing protein n=1 Tax=Microbacterium sp. ZKA21 TaxID=3381694 RepID=UPI003D23E4CE
MNSSSTPLAMDLSGTWIARADLDRVGERDGWYRPGAPWPAATEIRLPGSAQLQGIGDRPNVETAWVGGVLDHEFYTDGRYARYRDAADFSIPLWLQPDLVFVGWVWYQRSITVDDEQAGRDLELELERVHWESTVWVDGVRIGSDRSLSVPHRFVIPAPTTGTHTLTIRVDNSMIVDVGTNAHSVSDHTQGGWNGIIGGIRLTPIASLRLGPLEVHPDVERRCIRVFTTVTADSLDGATGELTLQARPLDDPSVPAPPPLTTVVSIDAERFTRGRGTTAARIDVEYALGEHARLWDEFDPFRYELTAELVSTAGAWSKDSRRTEFGLRVVEASGTRITVNGRAVFLRGTLECCVFPLTGYPPMDVAHWERVFAACVGFGLNHVRFHSWCPPEAAFVAADRAGVYLQVEAPIWANQGAAIGQGRDVDAYVYEESWRLVQEYGNHPSFLLMAHGNEPFQGPDAPFLAQWVTHWKQRDQRRLYTTSGGWPQLDVSDYDCIPEPRIQAWGDGIGSRINARPPETMTDYSDWVQRTPRPIVTHEAGQWCAYPRMAEIEKYTGLMKARNFEIARDFLADSGMLGQAEDFLHASGRLQVLCYKEEVESALRTANFGGIQLLGLSDFPGQGTAPVGVLDAFWEEKGYVTGAEFSRFFSQTVPLALLPKRAWRSDEELDAGIKVAHFGSRAVDAEISWRLVGEDDRLLASGIVHRGVVDIGNERSYGVIRVALGGVERPEKVRLVVSVDSAERTAENDWELWVYPSVEPTETDALITRDLDEATSALEEGRAVVLVPRPGDIDSPVVFGFSPVFWNTSWTGGQPPHTLGILCDPQHPAFGSFPTDMHTNWQWWELLHDATPFHLTGPASAGEPILQVIDSWFDARRLGLVLEARVGDGRLLLCALDILEDLDTRIVARQLRSSLIRYVESDDFEPALELRAEDLPGLLAG